jgi:dihydrofolate reductase
VDWHNSSLLGGDVPAEVARLKEQHGRELQVHGSGQLLRWLLERALVDELNLRIYPVIVGDGVRLFSGKGQTHNLELVDSTQTSSGVTIQTFRLAGRATFGNAGE